MARASLRKVGGSVMLAIPPAILDALSLSEGAGVELSVEGGALLVRSRRPSYCLDDLLAQESAAREAEPAGMSDTGDWTRDEAVGRELI